MANSPKSEVNPIHRAKSRSNFSMLLAVASIIIVILLSLFSWYLWTQLYVVRSDIDGQSKMVNTQLSATRGHMQVNTKVLQTQLNQQQQTLLAMQVNLQNALRSITHDANYQIVNQVSYLVHQSNLELTINRNRDQALHLLINARQLLKPLSDPLLFSFKRSLTQDIVALQKTKPFSVNQLIVKLHGLEQGVLAIPVMPDQYTPVKKAPNKASTQTDPKTGYEKLVHLLAGFKDLVTIRERPVPVHSLLSQNELELLKQNVSLKIGLAQWAVINRDQSLYTQSLQSVAQWLKQDIQNQNSIAQLLDASDTLSHVDIVPKYPELTESLVALNEYIKRALQLPVSRPVDKSKPSVNTIKDKEPTKVQSKEPIKEKIKETPKVGTSVSRQKPLLSSHLKRNEVSMRDRSTHAMPHPQRSESAKKVSDNTINATAIHLDENDGVEV